MPSGRPAAAGDTFPCYLKTMCASRAIALGGRRPGRILAPPTQIEREKGHGAAPSPCCITPPRTGPNL